MDRKTAIFVNGGMGRSISSIHPIEKYVEENADKDPIIICEGGTDAYKGHPKLHYRAYDTWHKNLFQDLLKDRIYYLRNLIEYGNITIRNVV